MKIKTWITIITLLFTCNLFAKGEVSRPREETTLATSANLALRNGFDAYQRKQYEYAMENFWEALYERPDDFQLNFLMGRAAFEMKEYEESLFAYHRAEILDENHEHLHYEKGRCCQKMGNNAQARKEFLWVIERTENPILRDMCHCEMKRIDNCWKHMFNASVTAKVGYDSNATLGTGTGIPDPFDDSRTIAATQNDDVVYQFTGLASYRVQTPWKKLHLKNSGFIYYREHASINTNDTLVLKWTSGAEIVDRPYLIAFDTARSYTYVADQLNRNNIEVGGSISRDLGKEFTVRGRARHTHRHHYFTSGVSNTFGLVNMGSVDFTYRPCDCPGDRANLDVSYRRVVSPSTDTFTNKYHSPRAKASYHHCFSKCISTDVHFQYRHDQYSNNHAIYTDTRRSDHQYTVGGGLTWKFCKCVDWLFDLEYQRNNSNIPSSDYSAVRVNTGVRAAY